MPKSVTVRIAIPIFIVKYLFYNKFQLFVNFTSIHDCQGDFVWLYQSDFRIVGVNRTMNKLSINYGLKFRPSAYSLAKVVLISHFFYRFKEWFCLVTISLHKYIDLVLWYCGVCLFPDLDLMVCWLLYFEFLTFMSLFNVSNNFLEKIFDRAQKHYLASF